VNTRWRVEFCRNRYESFDLKAPTLGIRKRAIVRPDPDRLAKIFSSSGLTAAVSGVSFRSDFIVIKS
jgi:hypothetical protein